MKKLFGLAVCVALVLTLSACKKSDDASSKKSSGPSSPPSGPPSRPPSGPPGGPPGGPPSGPPGYPGGGPPGYPGRGPSSDAGPGAAQGQPAVKPEPEEPDDHSDDPWYDHEKAGTPGGGGEKKPAAGEEKKPVAGEEKKPAGSASAWEPDKALLDQLEPYQDVDGYQIRVPKGYAPLQSPAAPGAKAFVWGGPRRPNGTFPSLTAMMLIAPPGAASLATMDPFLDLAMQGIKGLHRDWQETPREHGQVNGVTLLRARFQGVLNQNGLKVRGIYYAGRDGATFMMMASEDTEDQEQALRLAEAAILTLRKKP